MPFSTPSPATSSLSDHSDDEFDDDVHAGSDEYDRALTMPPTKRRRLAQHSDRSSFNRGSPASTITGVQPGLIPPRESSPLQDFDISSDSSGSAPGSPRSANLASAVDERSLGGEQVHVCAWDGCPAGDLGNQDELVKHVHDEHVGQTKRAKYSCEWGDCRAKSKVQLSAYALRAHMRSHTKEKPFYCELPECDRSFTRSDALSKHMRTVHESDTLKSEAKRTTNGVGPENPTPTNGVSPAPNPHNSGNAAASNSNPKSIKSLKLVFNSSKSMNSLLGGSASKDKEEITDTQPPLSPSQRDAVLGPLPADLDFTAAEAALPRDELYQLLRREIQWASEDKDTLAKDIEVAETRHKTEWLKKEMTLENVIEAEHAGTERSAILQDGKIEGLAGQDALVESEGGKVEKSHAILENMANDANMASNLPMHGQAIPWYRNPAIKRLRASTKIGADLAAADHDMKQETSEQDAAEYPSRQSPEALMEPEPMDGDDDTEAE